MLSIKYLPRWADLHCSPVDPSEIRNSYHFRVDWTQKQVQLTSPWLVSSFVLVQHCPHSTDTQLLPNHVKPLAIHLCPVWVVPSTGFNALTLHMTVLRENRIQFTLLSFPDTYFILYLWRSHLLAHCQESGDRAKWCHSHAALCPLLW